MMAAVTTPSSVILDCLIALSFDLVTEVRRRRPERDHLALLLVVRSLGIGRALQSAMVATEAANLSIIWADDRTALGYSQLAARRTGSSKTGGGGRGQHSLLLGRYPFIWFRFLVASPPVPELLLFAKHLFGAAIAGGDAARLAAVRSAAQVR